METARSWHAEARQSMKDAAADAEFASKKDTVAPKVAAAVEAALWDDAMLEELIEAALSQCAEDILVDKMKNFGATQKAKREKEAARRADEEARAKERERLAKEREAKKKEREKKEKAEKSALKKQAGQNWRGEYHGP